MAKKWGTVDFSQVLDLQKRMQRFEEAEIDKWCEQMAKEIAARLLRKVINNTPVISGDLRRAWKAEQGNIQVRQEGNDFVVEVKNSMEYASYVEYGHRQTPGRYVPAIGKRLVSSWVNGRFILTKAEVEMQAQAPKILEKRLQQKLKELFNG